MSPIEEAGTIIALGFGPYDTHLRGEYSLSHALSDISTRNGLGANVEWAVSRFGAKEKLDDCAIATSSMVRVYTGESESPVDGGPPRAVILWPKYKPGDVRMMVCSKVTQEDYVNSRVLKNGDDFARDIIATGTPKIVLLYQDDQYSKSDLPSDEILKWDCDENGLFYLMRDVSSLRSIKASVDAMDHLVTGLWKRGMGFPYEEYREIASSAVVKC